MTGTIAGLVILFVLVKFAFKWISRPTVHVHIHNEGERHQSVPQSMPLPLYMPRHMSMDEFIAPACPVDNELHSIIDGYYMDRDANRVDE